MAYRNGYISIDTSFARFGSKSYAIDKINSVEIRAQKRPGGCSGIIMLLLGVALAIAGVGALIGHDAKSAATGLIIGIVLIVWALRIQRSSRIVDYTLVLTTSSAEAQAIRTTDRDEVEQVRDAIETAMAGKS